MGISTSQALPGLSPKLRGPGCSSANFSQDVQQKKVLRSRNTDRNTLMSSANCKTPPCCQTSRAVSRSQGRGLAPASLRPAGLSRHLLETSFLLRPAGDGCDPGTSPQLLPRHKPQTSLAPHSTWHLQLSRGASFSVPTSLFPGVNGPVL